jgi:hypothetical protein
LRRECPTAECGAGVFVRTVSTMSYALHLNISRVLRWPSTKTASTAASVA